MPEKLPRPSQVTLAGWLIVGGSLGALVTVYAQLSRLHSLDTRESIQRSLSEPPFDGLGIRVGDALDALHVLGLVTGACAAAAVVLGWHVLRRHHASRIALTVLAVPLLLAGMASGGFFSTLVAVAVVLLWVPQSRDWFRGVPQRRRDDPHGPGARPGAPADRPLPPPSVSSRHQPGSTPPPYAGPSTSWPPTPPTPPSWPVGAAEQAIRPRERGPRPAAVTGAAVLTWILCVLGAVGLVVGGVVSTADPKPLYDEMLRQYPELRDQGITQDAVVVTLWVVVVTGLMAAAFAAVLGFLTMRGHDWARVTLAVCDAAAVVVLLLVTVGFPPAVLALAMGVVAVALLLRPESRAWTRGLGR